MKEYSSRRDVVSDLLRMCSQKYGDPEILKMPFTIGDRGADPNQPPVYMSCHNRDTHPEWEEFCGPGHTFHKWNLLPDTFEETTKKIANEGQKSPIIDKIGWYGNISTTSEAPEGHTRLKLKEIADSLPDFFEVVNASKTAHKTLPELVRDYRYLIDVGGNGYSGRVKYLLFSGRPLLMVDRLYVEYFHSDLIPYVHYIPVKMDLSDLLEKERWMRENEGKCQEIAQSAFDFAVANFSKEKILERAFQVYKKLKEQSEAPRLSPEIYEDENVRAEVIKGNFPDRFKAFVSSKKQLFVTRTDRFSGWGQDIRVMVEDKNTGKKHEIKMGSSQSQTKSTTIYQYLQPKSE